MQNSQHTVQQIAPVGCNLHCLVSGCGCQRANYGAATESSYLLVIKKKTNRCNVPKIWTFRKDRQSEVIMLLLFFDMTHWTKIVACGAWKGGNALCFNRRLWLGSCNQDNVRGSLCVSAWKSRLWYLCVREEGLRLPVHLYPLVSLGFRFIFRLCHCGFKEKCLGK